MKRLIASLAVSASLLSTGPLLADHPEIEFVQALRAKGYVDLADEYLEELAARPKLPKEVLMFLPLERARTKIAIAKTIGDAARQTAMYELARQQLEAFVKANAALPQAAEANLELAKIVVSQAKSIYNRAHLEEEGGARKAAMKAARAKFEDAGLRLKDAADRIDNNPKAKLEAQFEQAKNLLDQELTYSLDEAAKRGELNTAASAAFTALAAKDDKNPLSWEARAYLVRCFDEVDKSQQAIDEYKKFAAASGPQLEPGKRLARVYYIHARARKAETRDLPEIVKEGESWIKDYASFAKSSEGQAVLFALAHAYERMAKGTRDQTSEAAKLYYENAEKAYTELEQGDSEYKQKAQQNKISILIERKPELAKGDITKLSSFLDCWVRAQLEVGESNNEERKFYTELKGKSPEAFQKAQKEFAVKQKLHQKNVIQAVHRALDFADDTTSDQNLVDARFLLIYYLLLVNDPYRAAIVGEDLCRLHPTSNRAGTAGAYALHAYAQILDEQEKAGALAPSLKIDRTRLRDLAHFIIARWPNEVAADSARHQLGSLAIRQNKFPEAIEILAKISPNYGLYIQSQFQLANAATQAQKSKLPVPPGVASWQELAANAFKKIPAPHANDLEGTRYYLFAKIDLAKIMFAAKQYDDMEKLLAELTTRLNSLPDKKLANDFKASVDTLEVYGKFGKADAEANSDHADRYTKVRALVDPVVDRIKKKEFPNLEPSLLRAVFGLALRANLMDGKIDRAKEILEAVQQTAGDFENQGKILLDIVKELTSHVQRLKDKGPAAAKEYQETVAKFSVLLDELAKQPIEKMKPENIMFLANSYSGMGKNAQAVVMLKKIPVPKDGDTDAEKFHSIVQMMILRELRLSKDLKGAEALHAELAKTPWGRKSINLRKEEYHLYEDLGKFGAAANGWNKMMSDLKKIMQAGGDAALKEQYNESMFQYIRCMSLFAIGQKDEAKKKDFLTRAARLMVTLEQNDETMGGFKDRYQDLIKKNPLLSEKHQELRKNLAAPKAPAKTP